MIQNKVGRFYRLRCILNIMLITMQLYLALKKLEWWG